MAHCLKADIILWTGNQAEFSDQFAIFGTLTVMGPRIELNGSCYGIQSQAIKQISMALHAAISVCIRWGRAV
ncbi:hypothetical protein PUN4_160085 [Paraburkholderia unamae]|nr:hypothetical protein PUN4_160085 [Paraburkholderia unamae]